MTSDAARGLNPNDGEEYTSQLYAWVGKDLGGIEGLITVPGKTAGLFLPLVTTDKHQAMCMSHLAQQAADARGHDVRLVRFDRGMTLDVRQPWSGTKPA